MSFKLLTSVTNDETMEAQVLDPMTTNNGVKYSTERCFFHNTKYLAVGGYVPDDDVALKLKFDFPVILEKNDYEKLNSLLNSHFKRKVDRDMTRMEGVDAGVPVFGPSFDDSGQDRENFRAARLKMKAKLDKFQVYQSKTRMLDQDGERFTDLPEMKCRKAIFFCELYLIKEVNGTAILYRWSVNVTALRKMERMSWLQESTLQENTADDLDVMLSAVGDSDMFFNSSLTVKDTPVQGCDIASNVTATSSTPDQTKESAIETIVVPDEEEDKQQAEEDQAQDKQDKQEDERQEVQNEEQDRPNKVPESKQSQDDEEERQPGTPSPKKKRKQKAKVDGTPDVGFSTPSPKKRKKEKSKSNGIVDASQKPQSEKKTKITKKKIKVEKVVALSAAKQLDFM